MKLAEQIVVEQLADDRRKSATVDQFLNELDEHVTARGLPGRGSQAGTGRRRGRTDGTAAVLHEPRVGGRGR